MKPTIILASALCLCFAATAYAAYVPPVQVNCANSDWATAGNPYKKLVQVGKLLPPYSRLTHCHSLFLPCAHLHTYSFCCVLFSFPSLPVICRSEAALTTLKN